MEQIPENNTNENNTNNNAATNTKMNANAITKVNAKAKANANTKDCDVCYEAIKANLKYGFVKCYKCQYEACYNCYEIYMTNLASNESCYPKCMKCGYIWEYNYMLKILAPKCIKNLTKIREDVLCNLNLSLLPKYSSDFLDVYKVASLLGTKNGKSKRLNPKQLRELLLKYFTKINVGGNRYTESILFLKHGGNPSFIYYDKLHQREFFAKNFKFDISGASNILGCLIGNKESDIAKPVVNRPCKADKCVGYLSEKWVCYTCNTKFCKRCQEVKNEKHECDEQLVDNLKAIKSDSVECPNCSSFIFKISGCDQMWCTNCNTAFNWKTRKILDTKNFHNPHYVDYIRQKEKSQSNNNHEGNNGGVREGNRENNNPFCNDDLIDITRNKDNIKHYIRLALNDLYGSFTDYNNSILQQKKKPITYGLRYLNKELSLDKYKKSLQMLDKKIKKMEEIRDLNDVVKLQTMEIFNTMILDNDPMLVINKIIKTIVENNKHRADLSLQYKNNVEIITIPEDIQVHNYLKFGYIGYSPKKKSVCPYCVNNKNPVYYDKAESICRLSNLEPQYYKEYYREIIYIRYIQIQDESFLCKVCLQLCPNQEKLKLDNKEKYSAPRKTTPLQSPRPLQFLRPTNFNNSFINRQRNNNNNQESEELWEEDWESD